VWYVIQHESCVAAFWVPGVAWEVLGSLLGLAAAAWNLLKVGAAFSCSVHLDAKDRPVVMSGAPALPLLRVHDRHDE
jgi:hypothetical protein